MPLTDRLSWYENTPPGLSGGSGPASCNAITSWLSNPGMSDDHFGVVSADAPCMLYVTGLCCSRFAACAGAPASVRQLAASARTVMTRAAACHPGASFLNDIFSIPASPMGDLLG